MMTLVVVLPLIAAFLAAIRKRWAYALLVISAAVNLIITLALKFSIPSVHSLGGWKPPFGINLVLDWSSFYALMVINLSLFLVSLFPWIVDRYASVLMVLMAASNGFVLTGDLFNSFVFLEIMSAAAVIIAAKRGNWYASFKYLIFAGIGGSFYLLATVFTYSQIGSLNMAHASYFAFSSSALVAITTLYLVGLGVEAKVFPLNGWVSGVYGGNELAPLVLGTSVTFAAMYMVGRLFITVFSGSGLEVLYAFGLVTMVAGELAALRQKDLMKTLAYSSVGQAGLVLAVISKASGEFLKLAYFQLSNEVIAKFVLFLVAGAIVYRYSNLDGVFKKHKVFGTAFSMASFSLIGFPMFAGFQSKLRIILQSFRTEDWLFPALILFATVVELTYLLKWNVRLWFEEGEERRKDVPAMYATVSIILAAFLVVIFLVPLIVLEPCQKLSKSLLDVTAYVDLVARAGGM